MHRLLASALATLLLLSACGHEHTEDAHNNGHNNGNNGHNNGNNGHNNGNNGHTGEPEACWEWQRFHMHSSGNAVTVTEGADGEYTLDNVLFAHAGSWELRFAAAKGDHTDLMVVLLCVEGELPFAECFDDDPSNDVDCDGPDVVDVSCRGDEAAIGDEVHGAHGHFKARLVSTNPDPTVALDPNSVVVQLLTMDDMPVDGAALTQDPMCGAEAGEHGHED